MLVSQIPSEQEFSLTMLMLTPARILARYVLNCTTSLTRPKGVFFGKEITRSFVIPFFEVLAMSVVGATAEEEEPNDDESQASGLPQVQKENCYEVVGTLQDPTQSKPEWVKEVYQVN